MSKFDQFKGGLPQIGSTSVRTTERASKFLEAAKASAPKSDRAERIMAGTPRFVIALDATGSMAGLIEDAKASVREIITRASAEAGRPIEIQLMAYRDYDCGPLVLEKSPPSTQPQELISWLKGITPEGGGGNDGEAIEVALVDILGQDVRAVIVAGDEPPNSAASISAAGRQGPTALDMARQFAARKIPIHTFVIGDRPSTIRDFGKIAEYAGGKCGRLDGSREMIDMAVLAILSALKGRAGVDSYIRNHQLTHNAKEFGALLLNGPSGNK